MQCCVNSRIQQFVSLHSLQNALRSSAGFRISIRLEFVSGLWVRVWVGFKSEITQRMLQIVEIDKLCARQL